MRFRSRRRQVGPVGQFFMGLVFTAIGAGTFSFKAWPDYQEAQESLHWTQTSGTVLESKVNEDYRRSGKSSRKKIHYSPHILFEYSADGRSMKSTRISIGGTTSSTSSSSAYETVNRYPAGSAVQVFYNPNDSARAILEPGVKNLHYFLLLFSAIFILTGIFLMSAIRNIGSNISVKRPHH